MEVKRIVIASRGAIRAKQSILRQAQDDAVGHRHGELVEPWIATAALRPRDDGKRGI
jgi:hypothetical protein